MMQQIWALMVHHGRPTNPKADWSYYGGDFDDVRYDEHFMENRKKGFLDNMKRKGVNWDTTDVPEYRLESEFTDSFSAPTDIHVWTGYIATNDGSRHFVSAKNIDLKPLIDQLKSDSEEDLVTKYFG